MTTTYLKSQFTSLHPINLNPLNSETDSICENIYKRITDHNGNFLERYLRICETLGLDSSELILK